MLVEVFVFFVLSGVPHEPVASDKTVKDTAITLKEVVIQNRLQRYSRELSVLPIFKKDIKEYAQTQLDQLLSNQGGIVINTYGPGGVSGASIRGLGTDHTAVLWNGFNIQSPINGGVNLAILPTSFFDQVSIQYGGNGALFGSGALGGVIHLESKPDTSQGVNLSLLQTLGSFGKSFTGANIDVGFGKLTSGTRLYYTEAKNNFLFHNTSKIGKPFEHQVNANAASFGVMQNLTYKLKPNQSVAASIWYQDDFSRPQPMMGAYTNHESLKWTSLRNALVWNTVNGKFTSSVRGGYFYDQNIYDNPGVEHSNHKFYVLTGEAESVYELGNVSSFEAGLIYVNEQVKSTNYAGRPTRDRGAGRVAYRFTTRYLEGFASVRKELVSSESNPFTWSAGVRVKPIKLIAIRASISKIYRLPTFNELFWSNWGNPNLNPEKGYSSDAGIEINSLLNSTTLRWAMNVFNSNVEDWILWMPVSGGKWSPMNINKVWSRGSETQFSISHREGKMNVGMDNTCSYNVTTFNSGVAKGNQLPYVPKFSGTTSLFVEYSGFRLKYSQRFSGKRFINDASVGYVDAYTVASIMAEKQFLTHDFTLRSFLRIDNIWNSEYQVMNNYPMPLRYFELGIGINFSK
jgi:Outer membrane cobalamin receptor protein